MSKIIQISATQGGDSTPCCYILTDDGKLYFYSPQYGYEECKSLDENPELIDV